MADLTTVRGPQRRSIVVLITVVVLLLLAIGSVDAATLTVASVNYRFEPNSQTVSVGDTVRWTFAGDPHTVTSGAPGAPDGEFDSGIKDPSGSFQVTFDSAGSFPYFCQVHPEEMFGTVVVQAATAPPTVQPTASPTSRPTAGSTAAPTARPNEAPTKPPSAAPTVVQTEAPTASETAGPTPTAPLPSPTPGPASQSDPPPSVEPIAGLTVGDDAAVNTLEVVPVLAVAIVVGLLVAGGLTWSRRSRRT